MTKLMGENMMRKDGKAHQKERKVISSSVSPKTVKEIWLKHFNNQADQILTKIKPLGAADLIEAYAKPLSGEALKLVTGLTNMSYQEMDRVSQGMNTGAFLTQLFTYAGSTLTVAVVFFGTIGRLMSKLCAAKKHSVVI